MMYSAVKPLTAIVNEGDSEDMGGPSERVTIWLAEEAPAAKPIHIKKR